MPKGRSQDSEGRDEVANGQSCQTLLAECKAESHMQSYLQRRHSLICQRLPAQACNRTASYCVPLYDSLGENAIEFIIKHSEATIVFVASDKAANLAKALPLCKELVKTVVFWGPKDAGVTRVRLDCSQVLMMDIIMRLTNLMTWCRAEHLSDETVANPINIHL